MNIWSYPVKYGYGNVPGYDGFHTGEDRPTGGKDDVPVTVNGVQIGIAGTTGHSTGIHLHVGRWVNGQHTNPRGGGAIVTGAVVHSTGYDERNGNFVRVRASDGTMWVYLHLSKITARVGQELKGGNMPITQGELDRLIKMAKGGEPNSVELNDTNWMNDPGLAIRTLWEGYGKHRYPDKPQGYKKVGNINGEDIYQKG